MCWLHCCGEESQVSAWLMERKKSNKEKNEVAEVLGLMKGLDLHSLHTLTPTDKNQGLILKNENQGLQQHRADDKSGTVPAASQQGKSKMLPCYQVLAGKHLK